MGMFYLLMFSNNKNFHKSEIFDDYICVNIFLFYEFLPSKTIGTLVWDISVAANGQPAQPLPGVGTEKT
jgi:hypothetical protein